MNIRYPRPARLQVVPIASAQTLSMSQAPPGGVPPVPIVVQEKCRGGHGERYYPTVITWLLQHATVVGCTDGWRGHRMRRPQEECLGGPDDQL